MKIFYCGTKLKNVNMDDILHGDINVCKIKNPSNEILDILKCYDSIKGCRLFGFDKSNNELNNFWIQVKSIDENVFVYRIVNMNKNTFGVWKLGHTKQLEKIILSYIFRIMRMKKYEFTVFINYD